MINPMNDILGGLMQGASMGDLIRRRQMEKQQMEYRKAQDDRAAQMNDARMRMALDEAGFRQASPNDLIELQTGIRNLPAVSGTINAPASGVKSDLERFKYGGETFVRSKGDLLQDRLKQTRAIKEAEASAHSDMVAKEARIRGEAALDLERQKLQQFGIDLTDPTTNRTMRVSPGYADDAARGLSTIFQAQNPKPTPLRVMQSTNEKGDVTVFGVDQSGNVVSRQTIAGAGKAARPRGAGGISAAMEARWNREDAKAERKSAEESMRNLREQAEGLQREIDRLGKEKDVPPRGVTPTDWRTQKTEQQKILMKRKDDLYQQEASIKQRLYGTSSPAPTSGGLAPSLAERIRRDAGGR